MIYILHGLDISASYGRLSKILSLYSDFAKLRLTSQNSPEDFYLAVYSRDLFENEQIIVCQDFLSSDKIRKKDLKNVPKNKHIIFWEQSQLSPKNLSQLPKIASIENFKPKPKTYWFLDSISPNALGSLKYYPELSTDWQISLIWHLTFRTFLLICAKTKLELAFVSRIAGKNVESWQWQQIMRQASMFHLSTLLSFYNGLLRLDFTLKSGLTSLKEDALIPILLLKYLQD